MIVSSLFAFFAGKNSDIVVNGRVNRMADLAGVERIDGRVLKISGDRASVCWPKGVKTEENLSSLIAIVE
ncbi:MULTISPECIES: hypothetical protein [Jeongeupia]|uniref:Uncharacterized protein n=1 Tax=Jeongeupia chitinilytica TaxID=1041641 RepID=A0ABQ3H147_9NEIS|nr:MULTISPECIES: hypothetical protein [Jeongeupia]AOY01174.1 hypothetical protein BJP62_12410 [Jeongeupia sp. USM3]GHD62238.1 hypothetical protein GCM10007350_17890 [Jeongeupia chitinilytica]